MRHGFMKIVVLCARAEPATDTDDSVFRAALLDLRHLRDAQRASGYEGN